MRALENAVNRLPGMHHMGLENLLLEEPPPPAPPTPTLASAAAAGSVGTATGTGGGSNGAASAPASASASSSVTAKVVRPTAPGKTSIPWAFDAVGPLSQLARQVRRLLFGLICFVISCHCMSCHVNNDMFRYVVLWLL